MRRDARWVAVVLALAAVTACRREEPPAPAPEPAAGAGEAPKEFAPPADGRLTRSQVDMYAAVQRRLSGSIAPPAPPIASGSREVLAELGRAFETEESVAEELGYDGAEYRWVKARVMEARTPELSAAAVDLAARLARASLEGLRSRRERERDPQEQARLDEQIEELETRLGGGSRRAGARDDTDAPQHNRRLVERLLGGPAPPR